MMMILIPNTIITLMFNYAKHPMSMMLIIISQTLTLAFTMSLITKTFWMSYILFLVMLGGMLILFLYIASLASNEIWFMNQPNSYIIIISLTTLLMIMMISSMDKISWNIILSNTDTHPMTSKTMLTSYINQCSMLIKLYNTSTSILTTILIIYLLITLIAIVKITNIYMGPLRSNMLY
uniref:NADH-ubiquinone oxidoreductase chain 6 n=1 Tax=Pseudophyllus titan TaxID=1982315 RepID=A0A1W6QZ97_9ORTH|nr:NADH dehydrogenase subunit 6 [Pseudophyllus titan]ARO46870.1 NADH dehydrogenase subunit 6 [Pseudophyllus titan]